MTEFALVILRVIGLIWAVGAVFILRNARAAGDTDAARWLFVGGILTFVTGLFLLAASRLAAPAAVMLAAQQALFHWRQARVLPPGAPRPNPSHLFIAVAVAIVASVLAFQGALR